MGTSARDSLHDNTAPDSQTTGALPAPDTPPRKLLDQVRDAIRVRHYSYRTETSYIGWIRRCILFHGKRRPGTLGAPEVTAFLSALAIEG